MATKVSIKDLLLDRKYERGVDVHQGINDETTDTKKIVMARIRLPPKSESRYHYHENGDLCFCCISGKNIVRIGKEKREYVIEAGDFIYVPRGEIHNSINPSETEPVEAVAIYFGCSNQYNSGKVVVD